MSAGNGIRGSIVRLCIFVFILTGIAILARQVGIDHHLEREQLRKWVESLGLWGPLLYVLLYSLTPSLFLPGLPMTVAAGIIFGPFYGTVFAITGATIGASLAFLVARYFAREQVARILSGKLASIDEGIEKKGWIFVAITRLIPLFPFNMLNYAFGLTRIRFSHYALTSFVFMLPGTAAYVIFGSSLIDLLGGSFSVEFAAGGALIIIVSLIPFLYRRINKKI